MDILVVVVLAGLAASFIVEMLVALLETWVSAKAMRMVFTLPLTVVACWQLELFGATLVVASLAAGFFSLTMSRLANKVSSASVAQVVNRRSL
jgi:hypothetical protein